MPQLGTGISNRPDPDEAQQVCRAAPRARPQDGTGTTGKNPRVPDSRTPWRNTTHDWTRTVDAEHLSQIRADPATFAPGGVLHLVLEVVAYAADEAAEQATEQAADPTASSSSGRCTITLHADGSVSVADSARGTDTRLDAEGTPVRKPVMATRDLRFFDSPEAETLPDGHPRRGISVVAALSTWLVHTNHRGSGSWTQRYEHGMPVSDLVPVGAPPTTGTTVHFLPDEALEPVPSAEDLGRQARWPHLAVEVIDERQKLGSAASAAGAQRPTRQVETPLSHQGRGS